MRFQSFFVVVVVVVVLSACQTSSSNTEAGADTSVGSDVQVAIPDSSVPSEASTDVQQEAAPDVVTVDASDVVTVDARVEDLGVDGSVLSMLDDDFGSSSTLAAWMNLYPSRLEALDIHTSRNGFLTQVPRRMANNGWYSENEGPLLYKNVTGNFIVETLVTLGTATDRTRTPVLSNCFCQAGIVVRDAASVPRRQRWFMYNFGYQDRSIAREAKTTVPSADGMGESLSTLYLNDASTTNQTRLRVCRVGATVRLFYQAPDATSWTEETFRAETRVNGNGPRPARAPGSPLSFDRPDLSNTLQVGLYTGMYVIPNEGVRGEFDYVRFGSVSSLADCTRSLP